MTKGTGIGGGGAAGADRAVARGVAAPRDLSAEIGSHHGDPGSSDHSPFHMTRPSRLRMRSSLLKQTIMLLDSGRSIGSSIIIRFPAALLLSSPLSRRSPRRRSRSPRDRGARSPPRRSSPPKSGPSLLFWGPTCCSPACHLWWTRDRPPFTCAWHLTLCLHVHTQLLSMDP